MKIKLSKKKNNSFGTTQQLREIKCGVPDFKHQAMKATELEGGI